MIILPNLFSNTQESQELLLLERVCNTALTNILQHPHPLDCPYCNAISITHTINIPGKHQIIYDIEVGFDYHSMCHSVKKLIFRCDRYSSIPSGERSEWLEIRQGYGQNPLDVFVEKKDETGRSSTIKDDSLSTGRI